MLPAASSLRRTYVRYCGRVVALSSATGLPRRDPVAREYLESVGRHARPAVRAHERVLAIPGEFGALLPEGGVRRGSVIVLDGMRGAGVTALGLELVAAATAAGDWAAMVDGECTLGGWAAVELGVVLERFAVVQRVPPARWATVVAALLDGVGLVVAEVPPTIRIGDAHRLVGRARERDAVLAILGPWPAEAAVRVYAERSAWRGLDSGGGHLIDRARTVRVEARGRETLALVG